MPDYPSLQAAIRQHQRKRALELIRKAPGWAINLSANHGHHAPLHTACQELEADLVEALLEKGADPNVRTVDRKTPLHLALAFLGNDVYKKTRLKIVSRLLASGADVSAVDEDRNTPLHLAILHGYTECARLLLNQDDTPLTVPNKRGEVPLFVSGTDQFSATAPMDMSTFLVRWHMLNRPLHRAVATGDVDAVQEVLDSGTASLSHRNMLGDAPLHLAAARGDVKMVAFLLHRGAGAGQKGYLGQTALHRAAEHSSRGQICIDAPTQKGWTASETQLFRSIAEYRQQQPYHRRNNKPEHLPPHASSSAHTHIAELLLDAGLSPALPDALLRTPLHLASGAGNAALATLLLSHGADPNAPDLSLRTPAIHATAHDHLDLAFLLLAHPAAYPGFQARFFRDVGHLAVLCGSARCVVPDLVNAVDGEERTALVRAAQDGALASVEGLLDAGAYAGQLGRGWSPLVQACDRRHWAVAHALMARGADVRDAEGAPRTTEARALHLAARGGSAAVVAELLRREAEAGRGRSVSVRTGAGAESVAAATPGGRRIGFYEWNALHFAASMGHARVVEVLLRSMERIEIIARDRDDFTAMELAKAGGYHDVVRLIEKRLA